MQPDRRPLDPAERRVLRRTAARARRERQRFPVRLAMVGAAIFGTLWIVTLIASDAPFWVVTSFWAITGSAITLWAARDMYRPGAEQVAALETPPELLHAEVLPIDTSAWVEVEEWEDEGAMLVLQVEADRLLFLVGQEHYPTPRFPATSFELVEVRAGDGAPVLSLRRVTGSPLPAVRTLPPSTRDGLEWLPDRHQEAGRLQDLDRVLDRLRRPGLHHH